MEARMKTLVNVAVFGLVPTPTMADTRITGRDNLRANGEICAFLQRTSILHLITKRLATQEELARVREELEEIAS
jgi:hypothetical protein